MDISGLLIRRERLRRDWSQDGVCRGICAVSYLSKVEQGKAQASEEVLRALFARLDIPWEVDEADAAALAECRERLRMGDDGGFHARFDALAPRAEELRRGRLAVDYALLEAFRMDRLAPLPEDWEPFLDREGLAMQRCLQGNWAGALALDPQPLFLLLSGRESYRRGRYAQAVEALTEAHAAAAERGYVCLMLSCRIYLGNCYSDLGELGRMRSHYQAAEHLAEAIGDAESLRVIRYNSGASLLEQGDAAAALPLLTALGEGDAMTLHKRAICLEQLGRKAEALAALDQAEPLCAAENCPVEESLAREMLALVRCRLEREDCLHDPGYGERLLACFRRIRRELPVGYARFHRPWVLEWYKANRQYREAVRLLEDFPDN